MDMHTLVPGYLGMCMFSDVNLCLDRSQSLTKNGIDFGIVFLDIPTSVPRVHCTLYEDRELEQLATKHLDRRSVNTFVEKTVLGDSFHRL
jgi:hypothetical protein